MCVVSILLLTEVLCVLCEYYLPGTVSPIPYLHLSLSLICRPAYLEMPQETRWMLVAIPGV